jgi:hypothetical protein
VSSVTSSSGGLVPGEERAEGRRTFLGPATAHDRRLVSKPPGLVRRHLAYRAMASDGISLCEVIAGTWRCATRMVFRATTCTCVRQKGRHVAMFSAASEMS